MDLQLDAITEKIWRPNEVQEGTTHRILPHVLTSHISTTFEKKSTLHQQSNLLFDFLHNSKNVVKFYRISLKLLENPKLTQNIVN